MEKAIKTRKRNSLVTMKMVLNKGVSINRDSLGKSIKEMVEIIATTTNKVGKDHRQRHHVLPSLMLPFSTRVTEVAGLASVDVDGQAVDDPRWLAWPSVMD